MAEDTIKPPDLKNSPGSASKGSFISQHKGIVIGGVIILVGGAIFLFRKKSSSTSTVTPNTATPQVVYPTSSGGGTSSTITGYGAYNSLAASLAQGNQNLAGQLTSLQDTLHTLINAVHSANNPGGATNPTPPAQPSSPTTYGQGIVTTVQGPMVWLGTTTGANAYTGFNVGGGAPVYHGNATSLSIGPWGGAGTDLYTPLKFKTLVSKTPTHKP